MKSAEVIRDGLTDSPGPARPFPQSEYAARLERLVSELDKLGLDGAVLTEKVTGLYYTGFDISEGILLVDAEKGASFIVDFRLYIMARKAMPFVKCVLRKGSMADYVKKLTSRWKTCAIEEAGTSSSRDLIKSFMPQIETWMGVDGIVAEQRGIKSKAEIEVLRRAVAANDTLYSWVLPQIHPGMSEWEIRMLFRYGADKFGQGESFDTIVCAGANGAECHHEPSTDILGKKMALLMDFGVRLDNYCSDMTRCVSFGKPSALYEKVFKIVLDANRKAITALKPGMTGEEVDAVARKHIAKHGYADAFGHSLGHSVGMYIHEGPNFSPREKRVIKPGMVITVEPGIYLPGRLGVRIEDVVLVTRRGCECLSRSPRDLAVLA